MIPEEHKMKCQRCGKDFDMRDLGEALGHSIGECKKIDVEYSGSKKEGDNIQWTKDKKPLHVN